MQRKGQKALEKSYKPGLSKKAIQSSWRKGGRPALVRDEDGAWRYPVVFGTIQLHGEEGQTRDLKATPTGANNTVPRPHNKHSFVLGESRVTEDPAFTPENTLDK